MEAPLSTAPLEPLGDLEMVHHVPRQQQQRLVRSGPNRCRALWQALPSLCMHVCMYIYIYETYHCITALITITYLYCPKGLQNVMKSTLSVRPQVELQPARNHRVFIEDNLHNPPPLAFSTACWLDLEIHTLTWPRPQTQDH